MGASHKRAHLEVKLPYKVIVQTLLPLLKCPRGLIAAQLNQSCTCRALRCWPGGAQAALPVKHSPTWHLSACQNRHRAPSGGAAALQWHQGGLLPLPVEHLPAQHIGDSAGVWGAQPCFHSRRRAGRWCCLEMIRSPCEIIACKCRQTLDTLCRAGAAGAVQGGLSVLPSEYPPVWRNDSLVDDYPGGVVHDPYRWLENTDSPETLACAPTQSLPGLDLHAGAGCTAGGRADTTASCIQPIVRQCALRPSNDKRRGVA